MGKKIKATVHNGRSGKNGVYNADHNTKKETRQQQNHIDDSRTKENIYVKFDENFRSCTTNSSFSAKDHEKEIYEKLYGEGLRAKNERYIAEGHKERIKTMDQIYAGSRTAPMESIYQLGNIHSDLDPEQRSAALWEAFRAATSIIVKKYHANIRPLDAALHKDESVDHIHFRCTFAARDQYGHLIPNQAKALEQMGIQRPDPEKKQSKYNCPIISFTDEMRETFYQQCERQGFTIDREVTSQSHRQKDLLELQCERLKDEVGRANDKIAQAQEATRAAQEAQKALEAKMAQAEEEMERLRASEASERQRAYDLQSKIANMEERQKILDKKIRDREEEEEIAARDQVGVNVTIYDTIEEKPEKSVLGMVTRAYEPEKYIVNAEEFKKLQEKAKFNCNIIYRSRRYEELEKIRNANPMIQQQRQQIQKLNMELIGKDQMIRDLQRYKDFVESNNLEQEMHRSRGRGHEFYR